MRATKTSILAAALCATVAAFAATTASAQFVGGPSKVISVQQLKANGQDDQLVVLEGYLVDQVGHEDYTFKDATARSSLRSTTASSPASASIPRPRCVLKANMKRSSPNPTRSTCIA